MDWPIYFRVLPLIGAVVGLVCAMNVLSDLHDAQRAGFRLAPWKPLTWEATSWLMVVGASSLVWAALRLAPPTGRWLRFALGHAMGTIAFSSVHLTGAVILRMGIYAGMGERYGFGWGDAASDFGKDILAYAGFGAIMWLAPRLWARPAPAPAEASAPQAAPAAFDIQDGTRILRIPLGEILAVRAAGNYVEFLLADGRRPLMRAPLGEIEDALAPGGFVRTHRSWIVNPAHVRALEPSGSGDHRLALAGGAEAPVSRRFREALERLRAAR